MGFLSRLLGTERPTPTPTREVSRPYVKPALGEYDKPVSGFDQWVAEMEAKREPEPKEPSVRRVILDEDGLDIIDLRHLESTRTRIVGSAYWVSDKQRAAHGGLDYLLVREPKNKSDASAIAVYGKGRKVGYVSSAKAASFAVVLDAMGAGAYRIGGTSVAETSIVLRIDLPKIGALRAFAKDREKA